MAATSSDFKYSFSAVPSRAIQYRHFVLDQQSLGLYKGETPRGTVVTTGKDDLRADVSLPQWVSIQPTTAVPTTPNSSIGVLFRITTGLTRSNIEDLYLDLQYGEGSGGAGATVMPIAAPFLIYRIDCGLQGSVSPVQSIFPELLYTSLLAYSNEDMQKLCLGNALNMNPASYGGETAIASGATAYYSIPLSHIYMGCGELNPGLLSGDLTLNVFFASNPVVGSVAGGTLVCRNASMRASFRGDRIMQPYRDKLQRSLPTLIDTLWYPIFEIANITLSAGALSNFTMNGINDFVAGLVFIIRASSTKNSFTPTATGIPGIRDFIDLAPGGAGGSIDVQDSGGNTIFNSPNILTPNYLRGQAQVYPVMRGSMTTAVPFYPVWMPEGGGMREVMELGGSKGGYVFNGTQRLAIAPGANYAYSGVPVTITIIPYTYLSLLQTTAGMVSSVQEGVWSVSRLS